MTDTIFDDNDIATNTGNAECYGYEENGIYTGKFDFWTLIGSGIPANSTLVAPPDYSEKQIPVFNGEWSIVSDHRGETVYNTETGAAVIITEIGDYPENTTTLAPTTAYDKWNGAAWMTDTEAQRAAVVAEAEAKKSALIATTNSAIAPLKDAVELGVATDEESTLYTVWRKYRVLLNRVDTSTAPDIEWPIQPGQAAS